MGERQVLDYADALSNAMFRFVELHNVFIDGMILLAASAPGLHTVQIQSPWKNRIHVEIMTGSRNERFHCQLLASGNVCVSRVWETNTEQ